MCDVKQLTTNTLTRLWRDVVMEIQERLEQWEETLKKLAEAMKKQAD